MATRATNMSYIVLMFIVVVMMNMTTTAMLTVIRMNM